MEGRRLLNFRLALALGFIGLTAVASANGAMGLALEVFDFATWIVYVIATVMLEAWMIGRKLDLDWGASMGWSLLFNGATAFCCAGGCFAPFLHAYSIEPRPFLDILALLTVYGLISALAEGVMWMFVRRGRRVLAPVFLAHLAGIPLALAILLIPPRPYVGPERIARGERRGTLDIVLRDAYGLREDKDGNFKQASSIEELLPGIREGRYRDPKVTWLDQKDLSPIIYLPEFHRFDVGEAHRRPIRFEFNQNLPKPVDLTSDDWLIRLYDPEGRLVDEFRTSLHFDYTKHHRY